MTVSLASFTPHREHLSRARKSLTGGMFAGRTDMFVNDVFHELTHRYIRDILGDGDRLPFEETTMMLKYQSESPFVRTHMPFTR